MSGLYFGGTGELAGPPGAADVFDDVGTILEVQAVQPCIASEESQNPYLAFGLVSGVDSIDGVEKPVVVARVKVPPRTRTQRRDRAV